MKTNSKYLAGTSGQATDSKTHPIMQSATEAGILQAPMEAGTQSVSTPVSHLRTSTTASDVRRLAAGAGVALAGKLIGRSVRLVGDVFLAHILGPASFGLYAIGWTLTRVATVLTPLGLDAGVIRFASPSRGQDSAKVKGVITQSLQFSAMSGLALGAAFYFLAPWLGRSVFHQTMLTPVFRCFAFAFPLVTCLKVASAATRASQRMKFSVYTEEVGQPAAALLLILIFYLCGWKLGGALAAFIFSFGLALVAALHYIRQLFPEVISKHIKPALARKELFLFSLPTSLTIMFGILLLWVDRLFVGYYRSAGEAGIYHAASQLSIAIAVILSGFGAIVNPMFADFYHRGKKERLEELFRVCTKWSFYLSIPPFLVMCFVPHEVMSVIFGKAYVSGWAVLPILGVGQLINSGTGPVGALLVMTGHQNQLSVLSGALFLANVLCAVLLVPRLGMLGAALGTAATVGLLCVLSIFMARVVLKLWPYDSRYSKGLLATAAATAALLLLRRLPITSPFVALMGAVVVSALVFVFVLALLGLDAEDKEFLQLVSDRLLRQAKS
jgi:O-antigen/teichoic acid export membrane protein